ncbi:MAG: xanthine dehydrogenase family protein molybdopterin-binding subunit [Hyphomicrobiales bacterium]|nr:xanthine dehydrogenase family protein molybdopterin-binding subunit [Hyphomicrobiales bacterium]
MHAMDAAPNRRSFLVHAAASGGILTLGFALSSGPQTTAAHEKPEVTAWIAIAPDETVVIRVARSEMGQGVQTSLPMLVAEELECDWRKVRAEFPRPDENLRRQRPWGDFSTGGSRSIRNSQDALRRAGATAREMLIAAAALAWGVAASACQARNGVITHEASGRSVSYGRIAAAAARIPPPDHVALKAPGQWRLIGQPMRRLDVPDKVTGKPIYGIDVRLPGMLHAAIAHCPVFKGTVKSIDARAALARSGVHQVIRLKDAVAVAADTWWQAKQALDAVTIVWDDGDSGTVSSNDIRAFLKTGLTASQAGVGRRQGDLASGLAASVHRIESDYSVPFLAHATLEPQNCTAHVMGDTAEIWVPTQNGEAALVAAANALGVPPQNVRVHKTMLGGGFGRRGIPQDFVPPAVLIAREVGRPVKVVWSREQDMAHDYYRPAAMARMTVGLGADGLPLAWHVRLTGPSIWSTLIPNALRGGVDRQFQEGFLADMPYDIPHYLADYAIRNTHVPVGFWRCVNHTQNCFFRESMIDEMAHAAAIDPLTYRRRLIGGHRHAAKFLGVLNAAAAHAGWTNQAPAGVFRGLALNEAYHTFVAAVAELTITPEETVRMQRIVVALDPGTVVNPLTVEMQTESAVVFGLTAALYGEITIRDGRAEQANFNDYRLLRLADMPKVETVLVPSGGFWGGCGEPPVAVVAPALCNAVFAATGRRIRSLPLKNHAVVRT